ncbi:hypothetical protein F5144DRAFT_548138 [Chaetomium tenue]|uniref:Uncharacterized protein n=1 Tax=Chaetomium tenue TaxID=1854479 RepID=A0ACB7P9J6_9PEZI|nr:hypothetical protein F5144DRAFT_548138 [Chaetomium globosum]
MTSFVYSPAMASVFVPKFTTHSGSQAPPLPSVIIPTSTITYIGGTPAPPPPPPIFFGAAVQPAHTHTHSHTHTHTTALPCYGAAVAFFPPPPPPPLMQMDVPQRYAP